MAAIGTVAMGSTGGVMEVVVDVRCGWRGEQVLWCEIGWTRESFSKPKSSVGVPVCDMGGVESSQGKCIGGHLFCMEG